MNVRATPLSLIVIYFNIGNKLHQILAIQTVSSPISCVLFDLYFPLFLILLYNYYSIISSKT